MRYRGLRRTGPRRAVMPHPPPRAEIIEQLGEAVYPSFAMLAGMQLDVFTPLKDGPLSAAQLAAAIGVDSTRLRPLLYALVTTGLLEVEEELFSNAPEADHFLVRDRESYIGERHYLWSDLWNAVLKTAETIRTGTPQAKHDFSAMSREELESFLRGLHPRAVAAGREFAQSCDLSSCVAFLDGGGGSGGFSIGLTEACPHLRATVVDLSKITPITQRFVDEAGAAERVQVATVDVVREPLKDTYDIAVLKNFIQVLAPEQARRALEHTSAAINPGGSIYIMGDILEDSRLAPADTVAFNLVFINVYEEGQAYTRQEYREWLAQVGFEDIEFVSAEMVKARKPDRL